MIKLKLSDKQFDALELDTRRSIIRQLMFVSTPKYDYTLGAMGDLWTMNRYDALKSTGSDRFGDRSYPKDYECEIVDKWL